MVEHYRAGGVDERTRIFATFEYPNFTPHIPTLADNKVSDRVDFQQIISASGGLALDIPANYYFTREQVYRDWVVDAIQWARSNNYSVMIIVSPRNSGINYHHHVQSFVDALGDADALPNVFSVENYSTQDPSIYPNIVGSEDVPYHQLGAARLLQTQYLPMVMGRASDIDGDGMAGLSEQQRGRSDFDPSDMGFDFDVAGSSEGWASTNINNLSVANGVLSGTATSSDPRLARSGLYLDGGQTQNILVKMKASAAGGVQLYWGTDSGGIASANYKNAHYSTPNEWSVINFRVGSHVRWRGQRITALRLDPIGVAGATFDIDWILGSDGDFDRDGLSDEEEGFVDTNGDGSPDAMDVDSDGDGVTDDREGVIGTNRLDPSDMHFGAVPRIPGSSEGWFPSNVAQFQTGGDVLMRGVASNGDPSVRRREFYFSGADASTIFVRYRSSAASTVHLYWGVLGHDVFSGNRMVSASYTTPNEWKTLSFDLSTVSLWTGSTITSLRVDPGSVAGSEFQVDSIWAGP